MIKKTGNKIKLGIFISLGVMLLIVGIYFIGEGQQLFRTTFSVTGVFKDVAGLQAGNNVRLSGVNVGTVKNIVIVSDTSVSVEILIDESIREFIKKDAVAIIGSEGLMGNKALIINPGTGKKQVIENNDIIQTIQPVTIDDIMIELYTTMGNTSNITSDLASMTQNIESGEGTIGRLIMDKKWRESFETTFINLREGSAHFRNLMSKANEIDEIILSVKETIKNTSDITRDLASISGNIESGHGTLGRFLMDQSTANNLDSTIIFLKDGSKNLNILLKEAKSSWLLWGF
ncbi:MAG: MlaD family protein [Melioribacteraceae bacterium]|nr:MlaD family protein [Melioribacteraceae bacterium]MCF8396056.1 MlaD family protein [Melioribacteraceae bacterium]MCF8418954.1 MlaD family protein [Melioribacteraceae bacterium]